MQAPSTTVVNRFIIILEAAMELRETLSIYQIFIRNYTEEGTFHAALKRLREVAELGFGWVYLTPIHPIGKVARKGGRGSPYAIADYRSVDGELGSIDDLRAFVAEVKRLGMRLMIDVVYNHTAPDSRLAAEHPDWFLRGGDGRPGRKCDDWSDVVDLDHRAGPERGALWDELIGTLEYWRDLGIEGFRCDVASLVPQDFWIEARRRVNRRDPETGIEARPTLWLAESVHPHFLLSMRDRGFGAWSEPELHGAFDLTYDYDGWERLEKVWAGERPLEYYLDYLATQRALYPAGGRKIRYLENHDQARAAFRFGAGKRLEAWTAFYQLLPGCTFAYMGQERGIDRYPSLFEKESVDWKSGSDEFAAFFKKCFALTQGIKGEAEKFSYRILAEGLVLLERSGPAGRYAALCNLDDRSGFITLQDKIQGTELLTGKEVSLAGKIALPRGALIVKVG